MVHVRLQHKPVEGIERLVAELVNKVELNLSHLLLFCCLSWPPISLAKRKVAVDNKPLKGDRAVFKNSAAEVLTSAFRDFCSQRLAGLDLVILDCRASLMQTFLTRSSPVVGSETVCRK